VTRKASIRDVAEAAGVSAATVSKVLRGDPGVHETTRDSVNRAIRALDYRIDPLAANLRRGQRSLVGVIVPDFQNPFFGEIVATLESLADAEGLALVAMSSWESDAREAELIRKMNDWRVAGLVIAPVVSGAVTAGRLAQCGLHATLIDRTDGGTGYDSISADSTAGTAEAARALIASGHRRVLLVASSRELPNMAARVEGFLAAVRGRIETDIVWCGRDRAAMGGILAAHLDRTSRPDALFPLFLPGLIVTLRELRARGWHYPAGVSLVCFDDADWLAAIDPPIDAVAQPVRDLGREAFRRLLLRIRGSTAPGESCLLPCHFHRRGSIAARSAT
jgi:DNA-binding LacI/PurR family transcriptional regulator